MGKLICSLSLLFITSSAGAQRIFSDGNWGATLAGAMVPLPTFTLGIQPGVLYKISGRVSLLTELTIPVVKNIGDNSGTTNQKYFRIQPEFRYHFPFNMRRNNIYMGLRLSYAIRKFEDADGGFYSDVTPGFDEGYYFDKAQVNSPIMTSSLQVGTITNGNNKITTDVFWGFGVRYINTEYTDVVNPVSGIRNRPADGPLFYPSYSYNRAVTWLHVNGGFRLIYHFGR